MKLKEPEKKPKQEQKSSRRFQQQPNKENQGKHPSCASCRVSCKGKVVYEFSYIG